jgi:uncharacterized protein YhaN
MQTILAATDAAHGAEGKGVKIRSATIDGFGKLSGITLDFDADAVILEGPNETGKSTVLGFVRAMLYGFATRANMPERQEPVYGGRHGGRLALVSERHGELVLERYSGSAGGKPMLRGRRGDEPETLEQRELERLLLGGLTGKAYRQLFAVGLSELRDLGAVQGEELGRFLYHAGMADGRLLAEAEQTIREAMDRLYKPRGTAQPMNRRLAVLERIERELRALPDPIARYNEVSAALEKAAEEIREVEAKLPELAQGRDEAARALKMREKWLRLRELDARRAALPDPGRLPADAETKWRMWTAERERLERERLRLEAALREARSERERLAIRDDLLVLEPELERLLQSSEAMRALEQSCAEWRAERRLEEERMNALLASAGTAWTAGRLRGLAAGVAERDRIRAFRADLSEAEREAARCAEAERQLGEQEREAAAESAAAEAASGAENVRDGEDDPFVPQTADALLGAWERFEDACRAWEMEAVRVLGERSARSSRAAVRQADAGGSGFAAALAAALGAAGFAAAYSSAHAAGLDGAAAWAAGAVGAGLAALAAPPLVRRGIGRGRAGGPQAGEALAAARQVAAYGQRAADALGALLRRPHEAAEPFAPPAHGALPGEAQLAEAAAVRSRLQRAVQARLDALREQGLAAERALEHARRLERIRALRAERRADAEAAAARLTALRAEWRSWLEAQGLPGGLSPEAALETLDRLEMAAGHLAAMGRLDAKLSEAAGRLRAHRAAVRELCAAEDAAARLADEDPAAALEWLRAAVRREAEAAALASALDVRMKELASQLRETNALLAGHAGAARAWFEAAGAADEQAYERLLQDAREARQLDEERIRIGVELASGLTEEDLERMETLLERHDEDALRSLAGRTAEACRAAEEERARLLELRGRLSETLERLLAEDARRPLLDEREAVIAQLAEEAERFAELALTQALIRRTRETYERERQPAVLRRASEYASALTNGRYARIAAPYGRSSIELETAEDGRIVDAAYLSRGAAEQVYLAIRLALADEVETDEPLPMLLDDLFVNFDDMRMDAAAGLLARIVRERRRQLIFLTCHAHTAERLAERLPFAKRVRIGSP